MSPPAAGWAGLNNAAATEQPILLQKLKCVNKHDTKKSTCDRASSKYSLYPRLSDSSYTAEHKSVGTMDRKDSTVLCKCSRSSV